MESISQSQNKKGNTAEILKLPMKPSNQPDLARFLDLDMLVMAGGRERTEAELLGEASFSLSRVIPTAGLISIIESQPV